LIWLVRPVSVSFTTKRRLAERFPEMTRQGITKHLQVLSAAGVIDGSRQGREHVWALNPTRLAEGRRRLERIALGWDDALARLKMMLTAADAVCFIEEIRQADPEGLVYAYLQPGAVEISSTVVSGGRRASSSTHPLPSRQT
jgi:DNA-binding transcriptional ArsR family regulator